MDNPSGIEKPVIKTTVGLYPLIVVDLINGCCSEKFERPEINIKFGRIGK